MVKRYFNKTVVPMRRVFKFIARYLWNALIAIDQFCNAVLFFGDPDETMSSRMGKHVAKKDCKFCNLICRLLNLIQKDHCIKSIEYDEGEKIAK